MKVIQTYVHDVIDSVESPTKESVEDSESTTNANSTSHSGDSCDNPKISPILKRVFW